MQIELLTKAFVWEKGQVLDVVRVVPHSGYSDDSHQYFVLHKNDEIYIRSGLAREI